MSLCNKQARSNICQHSVKSDVTSQGMELFTANEIGPSFRQKLCNELKLSQLCNPLVPLTTRPFTYCIYSRCCFMRSVLHVTENVLLLALSHAHTPSHGNTQSDSWGGEINKREKKRREKKKKNNTKSKPPSLIKCCLEHSNLAASCTCSPFSSVSVHIQLAFREVKTRQDPGYQQLSRSRVESFVCFLFFF